MYDYVKNDTVIYRDLIKVSDAYCLDGTCASNHGKLVLQGGGLYEGDLKNGKAEGKGTIKYLSGLLFTGEMHNNKMNGKGKREIGNNFYEGNFVDDQKNGYGEYHWNDNRFYKGNWVNNQMSGKGIMHFESGDFYEGEFADDKRNGFGEYHWNGKQFYKGNWINNQMEGKGIFQYENGNVYEGQFVYSICIGSGTITLVNGDKYVSNEWINKKADKGLFYKHGDAVPVTGIWDVDHFISEEQATHDEEQKFSKADKKYVRECEKAVEKGNQDSLTALGLFYIKHGNLWQKGVDLLRQGDSQGCAKCTYYLGYLYGYRGFKLMDSAIKYYTKAAILGYGTAMFELAQIYQYGNLTDTAKKIYVYIKTKKDTSLALAWYEKGIAARNPESLINYQTLKDVIAGGPFAQASVFANKQDYVQALKWSRTAADKTNDARAWLMLGVYYNLGMGVEKDDNLAKVFYEKAGAAGDAQAYAFAAQVYHDHGSTEYAYGLWDKAIAMGYTKAIDELDMARYHDKQKSFSDWATKELERKRQNNGNNTSTTTSNQRKCPICNGSGVTDNFRGGQSSLEQDKDGRWHTVYTAKSSACSFCNGTGYVKQ